MNILDLGYVRDMEAIIIFVNLAIVIGHNFTQYTA